MLFFFSVLFVSVVFSQDKKPENFSPGDYFMAQSSFSLPKGTGRYANSWILYNDFHYAITDHISAGAGIIPLFFFGGMPSPVWLKVKGAFKLSEFVRMSAGMNFFTVLGEKVDVSQVHLFGGVFGVTLGSAGHNLSFNYYHLFRFDVSESVWFYNLSTRLGLTERTFFMAELTAFSPDSGMGEGLIIFGAETLFNKISLVYGLGYPLKQVSDKKIYIPYLGVKLPFKF